MKKLGFGTDLFKNVNDAREKEWNRESVQKTYARGLMVHTSRILACDPTDTDAILRASQNLKAFLTNLENKVQSGEAQ